MPTFDDDELGLSIRTKLNNALTKVDGIEDGATDDQTGAEIKALYELEPSAFTDAQFTKLAGIEAGATADQTGAEIKALYEVEANAFTDAQFTKLAGIETGATADQTDAEIKTAYENNADTNAFTDADESKLDQVMVQFDTVADLLADTNTYSVGAYVHVKDGDFTYKVVASGGDVQNSATTPVELEILPTSRGYSFQSAGAVADGVTDDSTAMQLIINKARDTNGNFYGEDGTYLIETGLTFGSSGRYNGDLRGIKILAASGVTPSVTVGTTGANPYRGNILGLWVEKTTYEGSDVGIYLLNCVEANIESPVVINFEKSMDWSAPTTSRVAYNTIINPYFQGHEYGIYALPTGTGFANENTVLGGRLFANISGRLNDHFYFNNVNTGGVQHNRFIAVSIEGYSGGGSTGDAAVRCLNGSNENSFLFCRGEKYGTGWVDDTYVFDATSVRNEVHDNRLDNTIDDQSGENFFFTATGGFSYSDVSGGSPHQAFKYVRRVANSSDTEKFAIDLEDTFSSSGKVGAFKYVSPRTESRAGTLVSLETGYGEVTHIDDAGTILPRNNFAYLGGGSNFWARMYTHEMILKDGVSTPSTDSGQAKLYVDSADGDLKIIFGDGTVKTIATDT